jgi:hypothetical protein
MRRTLIAAAVVLITLAAFAHDRNGGHGKRHRGMSVSIDDDFSNGVNDCSALKVTIDGERVPVISETVALGGASSLRVTAARNGGIRVVGGSGRGYSALLCKAVGPGLNAGAIQASLRGNELTANGPDSEGWTAYYLITVPRGADLDLQAHNGPISIDTVDGRVVARATNGPISMKESTGNIDISTQNGPISVAGGSGEVKAVAQNGPLSVKLTGGGWNGNLEARTQNGPLSVRLPRGYRSGVVVEARGGGPINCRAEGCYESQARASKNDDGDDDDWTRDRRFEFGSGPANVKLSTVNGPLSIKNGE